MADTAWIRKIERDYMDEYGFVKDRYGDHWGNGNALIWTSWFYILRMRRGQCSANAINEFLTTIGSVRYSPNHHPGIWQRHRKDGNLTAYDDYVWLSTASYLLGSPAIDPGKSVAEVIFDEGRSETIHWSFGLKIGDTWLPKPIALYKPWFPLHLCYGCGNRDPNQYGFGPADANIYANQFRAFATAMERGDGQAGYFGWAMSEVTGPGTWKVVADARASFLRKFKKRYPRGMGDLLPRDYGWPADHPLVTAWK